MKYKILVVDDSALMRRVVCDIIESDEKFQVTDTCGDGQTAYEKISSNVFDAVILDIVLPKMNGLQLLAKMQQDGISYPVIAISSALKEDAETTILAMERGAFDFVVKPYGYSPADKQVFHDRILEVLRQAVNAPVVHVAPKIPVRQEKPPVVPIRATRNPQCNQEIIALACSTGGPQALHELIPMLPADLAAPIVIVQHMPAGFTYSLAERLNMKSQVKVKEAVDKEELQPGVVYLAPGGRHMEISENTSHRACIKIQDDPPVNSLRPCADVMYKSLVNSSYQRVICVVLTGMGADGLEGIRALQKRKATYVITESQTSCTVYGMPKAVEQAKLADETVPIHKIANAIVARL